MDLVFSWLREAGLKANLPKCKFLKALIEFLGHVVDGAGIHTVDSKIHAVTHFPTPSTVDHVWSFFGLAGFYRAFVRNFASIRLPLLSHVSLRRTLHLSGMMLRSKLLRP